ncbi:MAG: TauD/TfdA family dioxygenase, partial [Rhodospirillales bacterium]|jgi:hypothetical protein|nr:TauD/TfdA family dioxygenase [Rhodospirillales bacterium]
MRHFTPAYLDEIDQALWEMHGRGIGIGRDRELESCTMEDFPLPEFGKDLAETRIQLQEGPGFQMYRGFPLEKYSEDELREIFWGIGIHVGVPLSQSKYGDKMGDVRVVNDIIHLSGRGYTSDRELTFHSDGCDVTALFCLTAAKSGGISRLCSAVAARNELARRRPDLLEVLYQPVMWSRRGNQMPGTPSFYQQAVYGQEQGVFVSRFLREQIKRGFEESGVTISPEQTEALDLLDEITQDSQFHFDKSFQLGDMQLMNNLRTYYARTAFEDDEDPAKRRHLLRLWLSPPNSPALPETFGNFFADRSAGAVRGGNPPHDEVLFETPKND